MREPGLHQGIVPLPGVDRRVLRAPSQRLQATGQVVWMVMHPEGHQNHRTDAQERPPICLKASLESAVLEDRQHTLPLRNVQSRGPAGNGTCVQAGHVALMLADALSPFADGHPTDAQPAGDVGVGELSGLEQPAGFQASFFELTTGEVSWAPDHGRPL
jgi:hypothetical protein